MMISSNYIILKNFQFLVPCKSRKEELVYTLSQSAMPYCHNMEATKISFPSIFEGHARHYKPGSVSQGSRKRLLVRQRCWDKRRPRTKPRTKGVTGSEKDRRISWDRSRSAWDKSMPDCAVPSVLQRKNREQWLGGVSVQCAVRRKDRGWGLVGSVQCALHVHWAIVRGGGK